jgi:hypothetical protein
MPPLFPSYDDEKIRFYYPDHLQLKLVQVIHRHGIIIKCIYIKKIIILLIYYYLGERTPVKPYLEHVILPVWNLCHEARELQSSILLFQEDKNNQDNLKLRYEQFTYRRIDSHSSPSPGTCAFGQVIINNNNIEYINSIKN